MCLGFLILLSFSQPSHALIYKYKKPNGKLLFTDVRLYKPGYVLLNRDEINAQLRKLNATKTFDTTIYDNTINQASKKYGVSKSLIKAIIQTESSFNPLAVSKAGAQGLMQLMPKTALSYNVRDSFNSRQNIYAGTQHIKYLLKQYKNNLTLALAAYNAGETAVNKYQGIPPFPETQRYVKKVLRFKEQFEKKSPIRYE